MTRASLLGTRHGVSPVHLFARCVLFPSTAALGGIARAFWRLPRGASNPATWIAVGALGGVIAAVAYDLYRLPFVIEFLPSTPTSYAHMLRSSVRY